ncbi:MAG: hypothetical protein HOJ35_04210 [Bdellovibrionales bacterium]|jgi:hypothetical protein|nr:hypothetical protein [Bdellovibrionales bacterium]
MRILLLLTLLNLSFSYAEDCVTKLRCSSAKCEDGHQGHVMFVDINNSYCEVEAAKCFAAKSCQKISVIPKIVITQEKTNQIKEIIDNLNLDTRNKRMLTQQGCYSRKSIYIRQCLRWVTEQMTDPKAPHIYQELIDIVIDQDQVTLTPSGKRKIDFIGAIQKVTSSDLKVNSVVFSGHGDGENIYGDGEGAKLTYPQIEYAIGEENIPHIKSAFYCACSTGGEDALAREIRITKVPPGRIYAFDGSGPINSYYSGIGLKSLMEKDLKLGTNAKVSEMIDNLRRLPHRRNNPVALMCKANELLPHIINTNGDSIEFSEQDTCTSDKAIKIKNLIINLWQGKEEGFPVDISEPRLQKEARKYNYNLNNIGKSPLEGHFELQEDSNGSLRPIGKESMNAFMVMYRMAQQVKDSCLEEGTNYTIDNKLMLYLLGHFDSYRKNIRNFFNDIFLKYNQKVQEYNASNEHPFPTLDLSDNFFNSQTAIYNFTNQIQNNKNYVEEFDHVSIILRNLFINFDIDCLSSDSNSPLVWAEKNLDWENQPEVAKDILDPEKVTLNCFTM